MKRLTINRGLGMEVPEGGTVPVLEPYGPSDLNLNSDLT